MRWADSPDEYDVVAEETAVRGLPHQRPSSIIASLRYSEIEVEDEWLESVIAAHGEGGAIWSIRSPVTHRTPLTQDTGMRHSCHTRQPTTTGSSHTTYHQL